MSEITFRPLEASDVEVRVSQINSNGCSLLLYKDARCDMRLLDEAVGADNWECEYEQIGGVLYCRVGIYSNDRHEVVWKQDCGVKSNMEGEKGEASDAFKRACFKWGIGRELYTAPFIWVPNDLCNIQTGKNGKFACYDRFSVVSMSVDNGAITELSIKNDKTGKIVYPASARTNHQSEGKPAPKPQQVASGGETKPGRFDKISALKKEAIARGIKEEGIKEWLAVTFNGKPLKEFSPAEIKLVEVHLQQLVTDAKALKKETDNG